MTAGPQTFNAIISNLTTHYVNTTPQRTKLLDAFMAFLVAVGALQFVYCVLAGNYVRPPSSLTHTLSVFLSLCLSKMMQY